MKSIQVIQLINQWKSNCYLSNYSFDCPAHLIDDALAKFQSDYNRWYEGANALVMSDFPSNAILVGTPAINKR